MISPDYYISSLLFGTLNKVSTGFVIIDILLPILFIYIIQMITSDNIKFTLKRKFNEIVFKKPEENVITYCASNREVSVRYRALMHYISLSNDPSVKSLFEIELKKYNHRTEEDEYYTSVYRVSQSNRFNITKNIYGRVYYTSKDKTEYNGRINYVEYQNLEIMSSVFTLKELTEWVDSIEKNYRLHLRNRMVETQTLVEITWRHRDNDIMCFYTPWKSNVTFENRFFTGKKEILDKINFFLNNEKWYRDRGIPYNLGILLWGEPGCGKTGFIKALMNLTKRHGIDIKLSKKMNMTKLKEIIYDDEITDEIIIPQNQRILLFEDIDAMGDVVKDRDLSNDESETNSVSITESFTIKPKKKRASKYLKKRIESGFGDIDEGEIIEIKDENEHHHNNLSYFLNILDGLQECSGRIIIMTTNKPEYLDKALIRPGRIDFKINMTKATIQDIKDILSYYWKEPVSETIDETWDKKLSHADIVSHCRLSNNLEETISKIEIEIKKIVI